MSQWIWKFGEFELYHNMLLHNRRQEYGYPEPPVWRIYPPEPAVRFTKTVTTQGGMMHIKACGDMAVTVEMNGRDRREYKGRQHIELAPGEARIEIRVSNIKTFPCVFVDGVVTSDESWMSDDMDYQYQPVGTNSFFTSADQTPEVFPFSYEPMDYVSREELPDGVLFDFGKETFGKLFLTGLGSQPVTVCYGESREEACDREWSVVHFTRVPENGSLSFPPYAFRYIFVDAKEAQARAEYEYLPLEYRGAFTCNEEVVNRVWQVAAYTFHLNSREFFLDGIKRDRWVWSADAYQSLFVNRYLFFDKEIEKRTLIALGGKKPITMHINRIMDYSFFWIISLYEYYKTYGDKKFLEQIASQMEEVMDFCRKRVSSDGFVREIPGDWIFIDWAPMDKEGALCGEQILFAKALECYSDICDVIGKEEKGCRKQAKELQDAIMEHFYDREKRVFIDSFESGRRNVTRHSNILAYLFLPCSQEVKQDIFERVIKNDEVAQITTPYFKFYENQVVCEHTRLDADSGKLLEDSIRNYYGSMLDTGATTLYEEYDPRLKGAEHYSMYGSPYGKSLCHAWSASPIYLLGAYRLGVRNTGIAYDTFEVRPALGDLDEFFGTVPLPEGKVTVRMNKEEVRVWTDKSGGTLFAGGKTCQLTPGEETVIRL